MELQNVQSIYSVRFGAVSNHTREHIRAAAAAATAAAREGGERALG